MRSLDNFSTNWYFLIGSFVVNIVMLVILERVGFSKWQSFFLAIAFVIGVGVLALGMMPG